MEIRPVAPEIIDQVLEVYRRCEDFLALGPVPHASREMVLVDLEQSARNQGRFCTISTGENGPLVGVVDYLPWGYGGDPHLAYIELLMIDPACRSQGWGRRVVRWVEQEVSRQVGIEAVLVSVQANNPLARRFWERQGYRVYAGPELQPDGTTVLHLRKRLVES